jgi:uncharacterized protein (DUF488 family)
MTPSRPIQLFDRQRRLIGLLNALGGVVGNLDFQKLLFLYCEEHQSQAPYEFVPYKFGAFSFSSYADRRRLMERGLVEENDREWRLTRAGVKAIRQSRIDAKPLALFAAKYASLRGDNLVAETYRRFPYYATRSEIAERLLADDHKALSRIAKAKRIPAGPSLSTIGYEGRSLEAFLNELLRNGITLLCDVRRNAISRKYGFSKSTLSRGCEGVGIRYQHLPDLGIASEERRTLRTDADYSALFAAYRRDSLPQQLPTLQQIRSWVSSGERVALTCYERSAKSCHRHCVADVLAKKFGRQFSAVNL